MYMCNQLVTLVVHKSQFYNMVNYLVAHIYLLVWLLKQFLEMSKLSSANDVC
jgi:hypothetical protein